MKFFFELTFVVFMMFVYIFLAYLFYCYFTGAPIMIRARLRALWAWFALHALDWDLCPLCRRVFDPHRAQRQIKIEPLTGGETVYSYICPRCNENVEQMRRDDAIQK